MFLDPICHWSRIFLDRDAAQNIERDRLRGSVGKVMAILRDVEDNGPCGSPVHKAPLAQLDRASDFGSEGWGFDSLRACQFGFGTLFSILLSSQATVAN